MASAVDRTKEYNVKKKPSSPMAGASDYCLSLSGVVVSEIGLNAPDLNSFASGINIMWTHYINTVVTNIDPSSRIYCNETEGCRFDLETGQQ